MLGFRKHWHGFSLTRKSRVLDGLSPLHRTLKVVLKHDTSKAVPQVHWEAIMFRIRISKFVMCCIKISTMQWSHLIRRDLESMVLNLHE